MNYHVALLGQLWQEGLRCILMGRPVLCVRVVVVSESGQGQCLVIDYVKLKSVVIANIRNILF